MLPRAHMEEGVARMLHKLNDMVGTEGAAVLHAVQQLRVVDEDGELGASPVLPAKLLLYKKPKFNSSNKKITVKLLLKQKTTQRY